MSASDDYSMTMFLIGLVFAFISIVYMLHGAISAKSAEEAKECKHIATRYLFLAIASIMYPFSVYIIAFAAIPYIILNNMISEKVA